MLSLHRLIDQLGDRGVDGRKILRWIFRKWDVGYGLDRAGSGKGRWRAPVNVVMKLRVPYNAGNSLTN